MITKIEVNGFKSLNNFSLELNQGLNILVGPNGSGKTNIILFFEFLSLICTEHIGNAISKVGGAGSIFKKISFDEYEKDISFKIQGSRKLTAEKSNKYIAYEFSAKISNSFDLDNIYYSFQSFRIKSISQFESFQSEVKNWDLEVDLKIEENNNFEVEHFKIDKDKFKNSFLAKETSSSRRNKKEIDKSVISKYLERGDISHNSIFQFLFSILETKVIAVIRDMKGGETFNIVPSKVKEAEDAANPPGIKKDGSGLAATLYAIKNERIKENYTDFPFFLFSRNDENKYKKENLESIVRYLKLANSTIDSMDVINDPFDNRLVVKISINANEYNSVLPLSAMSDGTIKWITLITAILTSNSIFSIEEPENFLHPWMQAEIVKIMRNHIEGSNDQSCVIMTTHSESLLNYSQPKELIFVEMNAGATQAIRIENIDLIKNEISNSGLGLGHFYFSNSLF